MKLAVVVAVFIVLCGAGRAHAQDTCPVELMRPAPVGPAGSGHDANSYIYRAFTGVPWNVRAAVRCGDWRRYTFRLENAPEGMSVVPGPCRSQPCDAGTITWPHPAQTARDVRLVVTDGTGSDTATWTITVRDCLPGAGGCCVLNADTGNDVTGTGTPRAPWKTLRQALEGCGERSVLFLRGAPLVRGAYDLEGIPARTRAYAQSIDIAESQKPVTWIGWHGELPTIDFGYTGMVRPAIEMRGANIWLDNLKTVRPHTITFSLIRNQQYGVVVRRLEMHGGGPGINGANSSFLMFQRSDGLPSVADHIANNVFAEINYGSGNSCVKLYSMQNAVIEDNEGRDITTRESEFEGCFAIKDSIRQFTLRHNACSRFPAEIPCISGNMHTTAGVVVSGVIHHNKVLLPGGRAYDFNQDGMAGPIRHWNNTWLGTVTAHNVDGMDGPFSFVRDVFIGPGGAERCQGPLHCDRVAEASRLTATEVLVSTVDGRRVSPVTGELVEPYLSREGPGSQAPKGHMLGGAAR